MRIDNVVLEIMPNVDSGYIPPGGEGYEGGEGYDSDHGGDYPANGGDYPANGGDYPANGGDYPASGEIAANGGDYPANGGDYPANGGDYPSQRRRLLSQRSLNYDPTMEGGNGGCEFDDHDRAGEWSEFLWRLIGRPVVCCRFHRARWTRHGGALVSIKPLPNTPVDLTRGSRRCL